MDVYNMDCMDNSHKARLKEVGKNNEGLRLESAGPEHGWLQEQRLLHGTRSLDDAELLQALASDEARPALKPQILVLRA